MKKSKKLSLALALAMSFSSIPGVMAEETSTEAETTVKTGYVYDFEDYAVGRIKEGNNVTGIFTMSYLNWPPLNHGTSDVDGSYIDVDPITNNNAVRITENKVGQILNFNLPEIIKEKKVDVSFDFRIESLVETIDEETGEVTVTREPSYRYITNFGTLVGEDATVAHTFTYQNQLKNTVPATIFDFNTADPTKYNKMKYSLDFENGTYDIYINNVKKSSGLKLGDDELKKMMFQVRHENTANSKQNNTTNIWIDNFKVLPRDNKNITFEDYEEGESVFGVTKTAVDSGDSIGVAKDGDNKALKMVKTDSQKLTGFTVDLPKKEGGIVEVSFDAKFENAVKKFSSFADLYAGDKKITASYGAGSKIKYGDTINNMIIKRQEEMLKR